MTDTIPQSPVIEPEMDNRIINPGSIQINVTGAFIVDEELYEDEDSIPETSDIALPYQDAENISHIAVDIGGSLAKIVYFTSNQSINNSQEDLGPQINKKIISNGESNNNENSTDISDSGGRLNFYKIETERIDEFIEFIAKLIKFYNKKIHIMATGGGSIKFYDRLKKDLNVQVSKEDEMECLIRGLDFFITEIPNEVFLYTEQNPMEFVNHSKNIIYPYLLVNIGSGVSIIKVMDANSYDEMLTNAAKGDNSKVDMLVGDIYGTDYNKIGLKKSTIASSFGKVFKKKHQQSFKNGDSELFASADISRSLLYAISNNIGQIAYLQAKIHEVNHIYFGGSYIQGHPQTMNTLSYAINFWSQGTKRAYFFET
ncbi:unnamed protein product [Wickerhamomyces anomalus]